MDAADESLIALQRRFSLLQGDFLAYFEAAKWTQAHNTETIKSLRLENKKLREDLTRARNSEDNYAMTTSLKQEVKRADKNQSKLRKRYDLACNETRAAKARLESLQDQMKTMQAEAARVSNQDSKEARRIRALENRLDKAMIKYNESISIRKTYEAILERLKEERLSYNNQLAAIERTLQTKEQDLEELLMMQRDAMHARDVARAELEKFTQLVEAERSQKEREKREKYEILQEKERKMAALERRQRQIELEAQSSDSESDDADQAAANARLAEEQQQKIATYEDAFRQIKEATGVADVNEVIKKFLTQEATHSNLENSKRQNESKIADLRATKAGLEQELVAIQFASTGDQGAAASVNEFEEQLEEATARMQRSKREHDVVSALILECRTGIAHLKEMLQDVRFPTVDKAPPVADDTLVDVLAICEQKLVKLMDDIEPLEDADLETMRILEAKIAAKREQSLPQENLRVPIPRPDDFSDDGESSDTYRDEEEGTVTTRDELVSMAVTYTENEATKQRRRRRREGRL